MKDVTNATAASRPNSDNIDMRVVIHYKKRQPSHRGGVQAPCVPQKLSDSSDEQPGNDTPAHTQQTQVLANSSNAQPSAPPLPTSFSISGKFHAR